MTTKQIRVQEVADFLLDGEKTRANAVAKYVQKWGCSNKTVDRYVTEAKKINKERLSKAKREADKELVKGEKKIVRSIIKSKIEKMEHLQEQINKMEQDLEMGKTVVYTYYYGKLVSNEMPLTPSEKAYLRKTIKELYTELNKMSGDYEPIQTRSEDTLEVIQVPSRKDKEE